MVNIDWSLANVLKKRTDKPSKKKIIAPEYKTKCATKDELVAWIKDKGLDKEFDLRMNYEKLMDALDEYHKDKKE